VLKFSSTSCPDDSQFPSLTVGDVNPSQVQTRVLHLKTVLIRPKRVWWLRRHVSRYPRQDRLQFSGAVANRAKRNPPTAHPASRPAAELPALRFPAARTRVTCDPRAASKRQPSRTSRPCWSRPQDFGPECLRFTSSATSTHEVLTPAATYQPTNFISACERGRHLPCFR
jgi:hypothetical protein